MKGLILAWDFPRISIHTGKRSKPIPHFHSFIEIHILLSETISAERNTHAHKWEDFFSSIPHKCCLLFLPPQMPTLDHEKEDHLVKYVFKCYFGWRPPVNGVCSRLGIPNSGRYKFLLALCVLCGPTSGVLLGNWQKKSIMDSHLSLSNHDLGVIGLGRKLGWEIRTRYCPIWRDGIWRH